MSRELDILRPKALAYPRIDTSRPLDGRHVATVWRGPRAYLASLLVLRAPDRLGRPTPGEIVWEARVSPLMHRKVKRGRRVEWELYHPDRRDWMPQAPDEAREILAELLVKCGPSCPTTTYGYAKGVALAYRPLSTAERGAVEEALNPVLVLTSTGKGGGR